MGRCDSRRLARVARSSLGSVVSLGPGWGAFRGPFPSPLPPLALVLLCRSPSPPAVGSPRSADPAALPDPPFGGMAGHARARASAAVRDPLGRRVSSWRSPRLRGLRGRRGVFFGGLCVREGTARVGPCEGKRLLAVVRRPVGVRSGLAEVRLGARSAPSSSGKTFCGDRRRAGVGARRCDNPRVFLVSAAGAPFDVSPLSPRPWPGLRPRFRRRPPSRPSRASRPCVLPSAFPPSFALAARDFKAAPRSSASRRAVRRPFSRRPRWRGLAPASSRSLDPPPGGFRVSRLPRRCASLPCWGVWPAAAPTRAFTSSARDRRHGFATWSVGTVCRVGRCVRLAAAGCRVPSGPDGVAFPGHGPPRLPVSLSGPPLPRACSPTVVVF